MHYKILIPKIEIKDRQALWNKANDLATKDQSEWYWAYRGDEIVYGFENHGVMFLFTIYCANERIGFRAE